ncbi:MAG: hypothetical protein Q9213_002458 [Squamulea squamosa]
MSFLNSTIWSDDILECLLKRTQRKLEIQMPRGRIHEPDPGQTYTMVWRPFRAQSSFESGEGRATDGERLPPGGFALSDGFPHWFVQSERITNSTASVSDSANAGSKAPEQGMLPSTNLEVQPSAGHMPPRTPVASVLDYVKRSFDDNDVLDRLPAEAAANPGAWKAWQAHRCGSYNASSDKAGEDRGKLGSLSSKGKVRQPDDWSWEGVWERRVKKGVEASISDQVLYGVGGGDDMVGLGVLSTEIGTDPLTADSLHSNMNCDD